MISFPIVFSLFCSLYIGNSVTLWSDSSGSTSFWTTDGDGSVGSIVEQDYNTKCNSSPCLFIQAGSEIDRWSYAQRSINAEQYTGLEMSFWYYCNKDSYSLNRNCWFEYWCDGVSIQAFEFEAQTKTYTNPSLSLCDQKIVYIKFRTEGGKDQNFGRAWIDDMELTGNTLQPTSNPTRKPTPKPTNNPTTKPTSNPTPKPTVNPTSKPTSNPTPKPTANPTQNPSNNPTSFPSLYPTISPTINPTIYPTIYPSISPSNYPTTSPIKGVSVSPTLHPTDSPTKDPTNAPSKVPSLGPTSSPSISPSTEPAPTISPSNPPTKRPTTSTSLSAVIDAPSKTTEDPDEGAVVDATELITTASENEDIDESSQGGYITIDFDAIMNNKRFLGISGGALLLLCLLCICLLRRKKKKKENNAVLGSSNIRVEVIESDDTHIDEERGEKVFGGKPQGAHGEKPRHDNKKKHKNIEFHKVYLPKQNPVHKGMNSEELYDVHPQQTTRYESSSSSSSMEGKKTTKDIESRRRHVMSQDLVDLDKLWTEWLSLMHQHPSFVHQYHVLKKVQLFNFNEYDSNYYDILLSVVSTISRMKIYSHNKLARQLLEQIGFVVPQIDDKAGRKILQIIVEIYEQMEKIEAQRAVTFVHVSVVDKYDEDFKHNDDNLINDFRPKVTENHPLHNNHNNRIGCRYDIEKCEQFKQMKEALQFYSSRDGNNTLHCDQIIRYFEQYYVTLLEDNIHVITQHEHDIKRFIQNRTLFCNLKHCPSLMRYNGAEMKQGEDDSFLFYQDILDSIHCHLCHRYNMDYKITPILNNINAQLRKSSKFNLNQPSETSTFMNGLYEFAMIEGLKRNQVQRMRQILAQEEYDTDALKEDIGDTERAKPSKIKCNMRKLFPRDYREIISYLNRINVFESMEQTKKRNREFANWSRALRETVELFGQKGWEKRERDEQKWNDANNRIRGPLYTGMSTYLYIPEFNIRLCAPTSTSPNIEVAQLFAKAEGIVITLQNDGHFHSSDLRIFDCSWISKHGMAENERLLMGGLHTIRIQNITLPVLESRTNFKKYFQALFYFDAMLTAVSLRGNKMALKKKKEEEHKRNLNHLIFTQLKLTKCMQQKDNYIHRTFEAYVHHRKQLIINFYYLYTYFADFKEIIIQTSVNKLKCPSCKRTGNNINACKCIFCNRILPQELHDEHNLIKKEVVQLFENIEHIVIYTTSSRGDHEYVFDIMQFMNRMHVISVGFLRKLKTIEIKASHRHKYNEKNKRFEVTEASWLSLEPKKSIRKMKSWMKQMKLKWSLCLLKTKNYGAHIYEEDTLMISVH